MFKPLFVALLFSLFIHLGCDDKDNNDLICSVDEILERFENTDCIGDEMVNGCKNISCDTEPIPMLGDQDIEIIRLYERCTVIDCGTLECEPLSPFSADLGPGILTNMIISDTNGLPEGILEIEGFDDTPFDCTFLSLD